MALGRAKESFRSSGKKVAIGNGHRIWWSPAYDHLPYLVKELTGDLLWVMDYPGARPYIDYAKTAVHPDNRSRSRRNWERWVFQRYGPTPAEFRFSEEEARLRERIRKDEPPYTVVEPNLKPTASQNKKWPFERYQEVVDALKRETTFIQFTTGGPLLRGVTGISTSLRLAMVWMAEANAFLGNEGGLHHMAAACGLHATVIFGGYIPPSSTGYQFHYNQYRHDPRVTGKRTKSPEGDACLRAISTEEVLHDARRAIAHGLVDRARRYEVPLTRTPEPPPCQK